MDKRPAPREPRPIESLLRVVRGFVEASLVALGFVAAILLLGTAVALVVRGVYEGLMWLARAGGGMPALVHALVPVNSTVF